MNHRRQAVDRLLTSKFQMKIASTRDATIGLSDRPCLISEAQLQAALTIRTESPDFILQWWSTRDFNRGFLHVPKRIFASHAIITATGKDGKRV